MLPVAILAGGLATRIRPITNNIPKVLLNVAGKPFIERQLSYLQQQGVTKVILCVGYLGEMIRDIVGDGENFGLKIGYSEDGPNLLGTGGAIKKAIPLLGNHFFVLYGDSFLPIDFSAVYSAYKNGNQPALMTVFKNDNHWDISNTLFMNGEVLEYNKRTPSAGMSYIDYGLGVLSASVLEKYPSEESFDLADVYQYLSAERQLMGLEVHQRFYEIGSLSGLRETEDYFLSRES